MNVTSTFRAVLLTAAGMLSGAGIALAQDCTANAGGNAIVCGSTTTLTGGVSGTVGVGGGPSWSFVSGPVTPVIVSPGSLTTNVTGMTADGDYVFQLMQPCSTGVAQSQVTITAHPRPASFTAGPDKTGICATVGTTTLNGVIPAGFTGTWSAVNIFNAQNFGTVVTTNSSFSNNTIANPVFSLINKANHDVDPAYYAILTIVSNDGICSYKDTAVVRFCPNPALNVSNTITCIDDVSSQYFDFDSGPAFNSATSGSAGAAVNGTTITLNVSSQPAGGNITFSRIAERRIYVTGAGIIGTYTFTITVSNCCGTVTSPPMSFTVTGINGHSLNFQPAGHGAPEQLALYAAGSSGGEVHCGIAGTATPELFYFSINPADNPATTVTSITSEGVLPPGASTPIITQTGAGTANRTVSVNPGASGWKVGTYAFNIQSGTAPCFISQDYYIHVSDNNRPPLFVPDTTACYPGTGSVSATIRLPAIYQGVVNSSYFQEFSGYYNFQVISKPAGSSTPVFPASNLRRITQATTTVSNLDKPGDYVIRIIPFSGNGAGPFLEQEYACSGIPGPLQYNFTIHLNQVINSNAGSDQTGVCANTVSLLGNATGAGTGLWTVASAPVGASPIIVAPANPSTTANHLTVVGQYRFVWTITTPSGECKSSDTVSFNVTCAIFPVRLSSFTASRKGATALLEWVTASEANNKGFAIERSADGLTWSSIGFIGSKGPGGNSQEKLAYSYTDKVPLGGANYYRLKQTDRDGTYEYSTIKQVSFENAGSINIHPNPAKDYVIIDGLAGGETIKLYDATGRMVKEMRPASSSTMVQLDALNEGLYQVSIIDVNGNTVSKKIMKAK
ncbi:T9SS type A sorting domain-containing protein [Taibaiella koreensis]|uniref:T9SS type A sorting domain-containing protein n=1 Tax=Taibaiella koreensis TaxID=1268548 RepID=UPI000E59D678|nr:T9SS type A sorting domain-containing protein [Taibaiella koreensis]